MSDAAVAKAQSETKQEKLARLKKSLAKKENSLVIQIMESDLYDHCPSKRFLLTIIALGQRTNPDAYLPDDLPDYMKEDKCLGWCDSSQHRLAIRRGNSESMVQKDIEEFRKDGVVQARGWTDDNGADHLMYRIVPEVIAAHQRPSQKRGVARPPRYKEKAPTRGSFTSKNQPKRHGFNPIEDEDDA
jgi:hypothetical protein